MFAIVRPVVDVFTLVGYANRKHAEAMLAPKYDPTPGPVANVFAVARGRALAPRLKIRPGSVTR